MGRPAKLGVPVSKANDMIYLLGISSFQAIKWVVFFRPTWLANLLPQATFKRRILLLCEFFSCYGFRNLFCGFRSLFLNINAQAFVELDCSEEVYV